MKKNHLMFTVAAVLVPVGAYADNIPSCPSNTSLASVLGSSCTIGDKTFTFANRLLDAPGSISSDTLLDGGAVPFNIDTSNASARGFTLGENFQVGPSSRLTVAEFSLDYSVSISKPNSGRLIVGTTITASGLTAIGTLADGLVFFDGEVFEAIRSFGSVLVTVPSSPIFSPNSPGSLSDSGEVGMYLAAANTTGDTPSVVTLTSIELQFNEILTPEPSSLLLFGTAVLGVVGAVRRK